METKRFGLIGQHIDYSLSPQIFRNFFLREGRPYSYEIFNLEPGQLDEFMAVNPLAGFNVTIPYKQKVIPYLDSLDNEAAEMTGIVNCVTHDPERHLLLGYNTDAFGFEFLLNRIPGFLQHTGSVLILGTGATAQTVRYVMEFHYHSHCLMAGRHPRPERGIVSYGDLDAPLMNEFGLIVNTTPLGGPNHPGRAPRIPYEGLGERHLLIDVNYRPDQTLFMKLGRQAGARTYNGLPMLVAQAYKSWEIWKNFL
ncbi:MAG: shikimate dehydrogenase [Chlorobi bacterium]|nr:shikimate dehydrogenase [Chlorobiota bacterium]